jgi:hypothetical protein
MAEDILLVLEAQYNNQEAPNVVMLRLALSAVLRNCLTDEQRTTENC